MNDWITWNGGECPIPQGYTGRVETRYVGDTGDEDYEHMTSAQARELRWSHTGGLGDILAYRLLDDGTRKDTNPKDAAAHGRVPMSMVPRTLMLFAAMGFAEGDSKYVAYNFRVAGVRASVYISAFDRHWTKYINGQWADPKTRVPHLASCASCLSILIDGHVQGNINDDRPPPVDLDAEFARAEEIIQHVYEMNRAVRPTGVEYTIKGSA